MKFNADWQIVLDARHLPGEVVTETQHVAIALHRDRQRDARFASEANRLYRRIDVAAIDVGNVAQAYGATTHRQQQFPHRFHAIKIAADPQRYGVIFGLNDARRRHRILRLQLCGNRGGVDAKCADFGVADLDINFVVEDADQFNL